MYPTLTNAPIQEALIDINFSCPASMLPIFDSIHERIKGAFPKKEAKFELSGQIKMTHKGAVELENAEPKKLGVIFKNAAENEVLQYRINGFTFNKLRPYEDWDKLLAKAKSYFQILQEFISIPAVDSVSVRYINAIPISVGDDLSKIIQDPPSLPKDLGVALAGLLSRYAFVSDDGNITGNVILAKERPATPSGLKMVLDIEAKKALNVAATSDLIWAGLNELRGIKNDVFFKMVTSEKLKEFE